MPYERWMVYAILSAASASVIPILAKIGLKGVDSDIATLVRSIAMTASLVCFGAALGVWNRISTLLRPEGVSAGLPGTSNGGISAAGVKAITLLALTGLAGATSWVFYFKALKLAPASKVAPIDKLSMPLAIVLAVLLLGERPSFFNWIGIVFIVVGVYLTAIPAK